MGMMEMMPTMKSINPVIQLAKERALFRFTALAHPMIKDAVISVNKAQEANHSDKSGRGLGNAADFLQQRVLGIVFRKHAEQHLRV